MIPLSVLDLAPITAGSDAAHALRHARDLARHAEALGFHRYWLAEHHGMPGVASAATAVVAAHVADGTSTIRIGAGGIMLPNHAPLVVAEQFGTLAALHPGRIDLGLGRAPGADPVTTRALRRHPAAADSFPHDVAELMRYFAPPEALGTPDGPPILAVPGAGLDVPVWILGSSLYGAQLAAAMGLPYAFASHFAPAWLYDAIATYRAHFQPSARLAAPYVMVGLNVFAADTDDEARRLFTSLQQAFVNLRRGAPTPLPPPDAEFPARLTPVERQTLSEVLACTIVGSPATVERELAAFVADVAPDEIMVTSQIYDHAARCRSFEILAAARDAIAAAGRAPALNAAVSRSFAGAPPLVPLGRAPDGR